MRPCIVGIGGAGGNIVKNFLQLQDVECPIASFGGEYLVFGGIKGVWLDSDQDDASEQTFFGRLEDECYPGYIISHDIIDPDSNLKKCISVEYGHDLKVQGYDRRAEYLKAVFEIFDKNLQVPRKTYESSSNTPNKDKEYLGVNDLAREEFSDKNPKTMRLLGINEKGLDNPLLAYIWRGGFRRFTSLGKKENANANSLQANGVEGSTGRFGIAAKNFSKFFPKSANKVNSSSQDCDSLLFLASLGGGTGTGFINPLSSFVRNEERAFPIFALGVQTERGTDSRHAEERKRNLGSTIAMYDLLTKSPGSGIDGLLLVDNEILAKKHSGNYKAMDKAVFRALRPLIDPKNYPDSLNQDDAPAIRGKFLENLRFPPILIPCHYESDKNINESRLVQCALKNKLYSCDHRRADMAFVFVRGLISDTRIREAVNMHTLIPEKMINVYRKIGEGKRKEILILLRNPYGGVPFKEGETDTMESRFIEVMNSALDFMAEEHKKIERRSDGTIDWADQPVSLVNQADYSSKTKDALFRYFYGPDGLEIRIKASVDKLMRGENAPLFVKYLDIFVGNGESKREPISQSEKSEVFSPTEVKEIKRIISEAFPSQKR